MAITLVSSTQNYESSTSPGVTVPATEVQAGDVIILWLLQYLSDAESAAPSGFSAVCDGLADADTRARYSRAYYKVAEGDEAEELLEWTLAEARGCGMAVGVFRGVDNSTPFDISVVHADHHIGGENAASNLVSCPTVTTVTDGAWVLHLSGGVSLSATDISSDIGTQWAKLVTNTVYWPNLFCGYVEKATAGSQAGAGHTYANGGNAVDWAAMTIVLRPATGGGAVTATARSFPRGVARGVLRGCVSHFSKIGNLWRPVNPGLSLARVGV